MNQLSLVICVGKRAPFQVQTSLSDTADVSYVLEAS